ncbi:hypothetical protein V5738_10910 [Salinisphaera sp. SPP-AMP-43]|uniref:hypothetical protein n=1 Tax=Salinisphaera sp. SPP-AMP-43 TaxID=3121288 RepID=UPI003C6DF41A
MPDQMKRYFAEGGLLVLLLGWIVWMIGRSVGMDKGDSQGDPDGRVLEESIFGHLMYLTRFRPVDRDPLTISEAVEDIVFELDIDANDPVVTRAAERCRKWHSESESIVATQGQT